MNLFDPPPPSVAAALPGLRLRAFDPAADFPALAELVSAANRHDGVDWLPSVAALRDDEWRPTERFEPTTDVLVAELDGRMVGVGETSWRVRGEIVYHDVRPTVHPDARGRGLGALLLERVEARSRGIASDRGDADDTGRARFLGSHSEDQVEAAAKLARRFGYEAQTFGFLMRRLLDRPIEPAPLPAGLDVRPVTPDQHRAIWDADTEAFLDHHEPSLRDEGDYEAFFDEPELDTGLWQVAWAGDEVAGSVLTYIWGAENEQLGVRRAWLEHISTRRPWRGRGLARALIMRSLLQLRDMGLEEVLLGVHGENPTGAVGLYERCGFEVYRRWTRWRKPL